MNLLGKIREISARIQNSDETTVDFKKMSDDLSRVMISNVFIVSRRGKILGYGVNQNIDNERITEMLENRQFPEEYNNGLLNANKTIENIPFDNELTAFPTESVELFNESSTCIIPIKGGGTRLGTLVIGRVTQDFNDDDLVLAEYAATVVGMEILREKSKLVEKSARDKAAIQMAINSLSYSEKEAIEHIFEELGSTEGLLVASKVADRVGITRSVIVNALRKLESAGVIESRSLGMKGTFIKVKKEGFLTALNEEQ